jgi:hypothetical protein
MHHVHPNVYATEISEPSGPVNIIQNRSPEPTKYQHRMEPAVGSNVGPFVLTFARRNPCCSCFLMLIIIFTQYHVGEILVENVTGSGPISLFEVPKMWSRTGRRGYGICFHIHLDSAVKVSGFHPKIPFCKAVSSSSKCLNTASYQSVTSPWW